MSIRTTISLYTNRLHGKNVACNIDVWKFDVIRGWRLFSTEDTYSKSRTWEWMPPHEIMWKTKFLSQCTNLIFVEILERLDHSPLLDHFLDLWNTIVVRLDLICMFRTTCFYRVRIDRSLSKHPILSFEGFRDIALYIQECCSDCLSLFFWISQTFQC